jgi:hypothetical protein
LRGKTPFCDTLGLSNPHLYGSVGPRKLSLHGTYLQTRTFSVRAAWFHLKPRMSQTEYIMNIFYIIGVIVVIIFVAGFFGLHA